MRLNIGAYLFDKVAGCLIGSLIVWLRPLVNCCITLFQLFKVFQITQLDHGAGVRKLANYLHSGDRRKTLSESQLLFSTF